MSSRIDIQRTGGRGQGCGSHQRQRESSSRRQHRSAAGGPGAQLTLLIVDTSRIAARLINADQAERSRLWGVVARMQRDHRGSRQQVFSVRARDTGDELTGQRRHGRPRPGRRGYRRRSRSRRERPRQGAKQRQWHQRHRHRQVRISARRKRNGLPSCEPLPAPSTRAAGRPKTSKPFWTTRVAAATPPRGCRASINPPPQRN